MFGDRVFEAVLAAAESESGACIGCLVGAKRAVVRQDRVRVLPGTLWSPSNLACRRASAKSS